MEDNIMKEWKTPIMEELEIRKTEAPVDVTDLTSGQIGQLDLGTCNNPYWEGNGKTLNEAINNNPYWGGSWGN